MNISVIIPIYNDAQVIRATLEDLNRKLRGAYEVIVVDDRSSDRTCDVVSAIAAVSPNIRLVTNRYEKGFANALRTGFEVARYDMVVPVMADLCDEVDAIPGMCEKLREGYDLVSASRYIKGGTRRGGPFIKAILSYMCGRLLHCVRHIPTTDCTNSFKLYRKKVVQAIAIESTGFEVSMELVVKAYIRGFRIAELPTRWQERFAGRSHFALVGNGMRYIWWLVFGLMSRRVVVKKEAVCG